MSSIPPEEPLNMPFLEHLLELRTRLLHIVIAVAVVLCVLMPFSYDLFSLLADPLLRFMPQGAQMIAIDVASPFFIPFKLTLVLAVTLCVPYIAYQAWAFIAPGLYQHEKNLVYPVLVSSTVLFYLGMLFAYFIVFPVIFNFMLSVTPQGVTMMTDITRYLDFVLVMFLAFGVTFEIPVATLILVRVGLVTTQTLSQQRSYIIVASFVIGAIFSPPDVVSQTLLALPMWILFELGLLIARILEKRPNTTANLPNVSPEKDESKLS